MATQKAQARPKKADTKAKGESAPKRAPKPAKENADKLKAIICQHIAEGIPLREICRTKKDMPAWRTVYDWMEADESFAASIARARDIGGDAIAEQTIELIDALPERGPDGKIDPGWVAHQKLRAEHRLKLLAKWNPKKYGEKVTAEHTGPGGGAIQARVAIEFVQPAQRPDGDEQ